MNDVPLPDHDDYFRDLDALSLRGDLAYAEDGKYLPLATPARPPL